MGSESRHPWPTSSPSKRLRLNSEVSLRASCPTSCSRSPSSALALLSWLATGSVCNKAPQGRASSHATNYRSSSFIDLSLSLVPCASSASRQSSAPISSAHNGQDILQSAAFSWHRSARSAPFRRPLVTRPKQNNNNKKESYIFFSDGGCGGRALTREQRSRYLLVRGVSGTKVSAVNVSSAGGSLKKALFVWRENDGHVRHALAVPAVWKARGESSTVNMVAGCASGKREAHALVLFTEPVGGKMRSSLEKRRCKHILIS